MGGLSKEDFLDLTGFGVDFLGVGLERALFIRAARFLCIKFFFTARSIREKAWDIFLGVFCFFASLMALSTWRRMASFAFSRFLSCLAFLIADFITGTVRF